MAVTASVVVPLSVFPPGFESDVSFRVGMVIMIPLWGSAASLVWRPSLLGSKGPKGATCTSVCYLYIGSSRLELKA